MDINCLLTYWAKFGSERLTVGQDIVKAFGEGGVTGTFLLTLYVSVNTAWLIYYYTEHSSSKIHHSRLIIFTFRTVDVTLLLLVQVSCMCIV